VALAKPDGKQEIALLLKHIPRKAASAILSPVIDFIE
jgi:hypothetical protein